MNVLITGGYGCIGAWAVKLLLESAQDVWIYDIKEDLHRLELLIPRSELRRVRFIAGDISDAERFLEACVELKVTHILHLAGLQVPVCRTNPLLGARVNVLGTLAVFEAARALKGQVERIVYASSAAVHGPAELARRDAPLGEHARLAPVTHYGAYKICNENNARVYWLDHEITSVGLRPWTVYGAGRDFGVTSEPTKAIKAVAAGRRYHISYGGSQDLQYAEDVAGAFLRCLSAPYAGAAVYNVRGAVVTIEEFVRTLHGIAPDSRRLVTHGSRQLPIEYDLDDSALERDFGPLEKTPLDAGIRDTYERFVELERSGRLDVSDLA